MADKIRDNQFAKTASYIHQPLQPYIILKMVKYMDILESRNILEALDLSEKEKTHLEAVWKKSTKRECLILHDQILYLMNGKLHSEDGRPANIIISAINTKKIYKWYKNGVLHNDYGPAIVYSENSAEWYENGCKLYEMHSNINTDGYTDIFSKGIWNNAIFISILLYISGFVAGFMSCRINI